MNPILTIAIPTYNRAAILDETLRSLTSEKCYDERIEVLVSDNASTDNTKEIVSKYSCVKYYCNESNIGSNANFTIALNRAKGTYIRLMNDTAKFKYGKLTKMLDIIETGKSANTNILFVNNNKFVSNCHLQFKGKNKLIQNMSYLTTWIGNFGIWRTDFEKIKDKDRCTSTLLQQVDWLLRMADNGKKTEIIADEFLEITEVQKKGGYNIFDVFINGYLKILKLNKISFSYYKKEKYRLLYYFVVPWYQKLHEKENKYQFAFHDAVMIILKNYWYEICFLPWYYILSRTRKVLNSLIPFFIKLFAITYFKITKSQKLRHHLDIFYTLWLSKSLKKIGADSHIFRYITLLGGQYIEIGKSVALGKYGVLTAFDKYENQTFVPQIIIGDFCKIGEYFHITSINKIILGKNVLTGRWLTITDNAHGKTESNDLILPPEKRALYSKGPVIINDNVWIGDKVTIMPNVTIGENSIIGANAVVTRDVPADCVVGGNPAKILKHIKRTE